MSAIERIIINEKDQSQSRPVLSDVFNVLVLEDSIFTTLDTVLYEDSEDFKKQYTADQPLFDAICDLIDLGLGVYVTNITNLLTFKDKYRFDFAFLMDCNTTREDIGDINTLIAARKDFLYLPQDFAESRTGSEELAAHFSKMAQPSYGALYSPAVKYSKTLTLPASYCFLRNFATSVGNGNPAWYAIAGVNRGLVNYIDGTIREIDEDEMNECQDKDQSAKSNYNPIINLNNTYGNTIYGQRTLQKENTSLRSVNVRIISNMIKKRIFNISLTLLFEMNDVVLWNEFRGQLVPYLNDMKFKRGLVNYEVIMDQTAQDSVDDYTVKGYVRIRPTRAAEYFDIDFTLTNSGAEFGTEG